MRFLSRSLIGLALFAATLGMLVAAGLLIRDALEQQAAAGGPGRAPEERVFTVSVLRMEPGPISPVLTAYGEVRARRTLELRSPAGGTVIWRSDDLEDGRRVAAGQVLLRLDPAAAQSARDLAASDLARVQAEEAEAGRGVAIARDELSAAEAQAELRAQALARQRDLLTRGVGSPSLVEEAELAASSADQSVLARRQAVSQAETSIALSATATERQRITLAEAERALVDTELKAEFSGILDGVVVTQGGTLSSGERVGDLIDPASLELSFRVSTTQFGQLVAADGTLLPLNLTATLQAGTAAFQANGQLSRVGAAVGDGQTGRLIYATLEDAPAFRPGDFVKVSITEPAIENAVLLPATALGAASDVLILGEDNRLEAIPVTIQRRQGDDVLLDGRILAGQEVVREWSPLLGAGIKVRPVRDGQAVEEAAAMVPLTDDRRAALVALVQQDATLPEADRARLLEQLANDQVPVSVIRRLEQRVGG